jgi:hypothetical protein
VADCCTAHPSHETVRSRGWRLVRSLNSGFIMDRPRKRVAVVLPHEHRLIAKCGRPVAQLGHRETGRSLRILIQVEY